MVAYMLLGVVLTLIIGYPAVVLPLQRRCDKLSAALVNCHKDMVVAVRVKAKVEQDMRDLRREMNRRKAGDFR